MDFVWLAAALFLVAVLYSSVGHAGASGYIAVLALSGLSVEVIRPTALTLNVMVAFIGTYQFGRAGHFRWSLFWPLALLAVPAAFLGGWIQLPSAVLRVLIGLVLWFSVVRLFVRGEDPVDLKPPRRSTAMFCGAGLGFLAGLTGTGGGIFLTPLMLLGRWARMRQVAAVSVAFIFFNSVAGLAGYLGSGRAFPEMAWSFLAVVALGGFLGSRLGSRYLPVPWIMRALAVVLLLAGAKLIFG